MDYPYLNTDKNYNLASSLAEVVNITISEFGWNPTFTYGSSGLVYEEGLEGHARACWYEDGDVAAHEVVCLIAFAC